MSAKPSTERFGVLDVMCLTVTAALGVWVVVAFLYPSDVTWVAVGAFIAGYAATLRVLRPRTRA